MAPSISALPIADALTGRLRGVVQLHDGGTNTPLTKPPCTSTSAPTTNCAAVPRTMLAWLISTAVPLTNTVPVEPSAVMKPWISSTRAGVVLPAKDSLTRGFQHAADQHAFCTGGNAIGERGRRAAFKAGLRGIDRLAANVERRDRNEAADRTADGDVLTGKAGVPARFSTRHHCDAGRTEGDGSSAKLVMTVAACSASSLL